MADTTYEVDQDVAPEPMPVSNQPTSEPAGNFVEREVDPNDALTEAQSEEKQVAAAAVAPDADSEPEDVVDTLVPKAEPREWTIGPPGMQMKYTQRPLSFIGKMQWFSLVGEVVDKSTSGDDGINLIDFVNSLDMGQMSFGDLRELNVFAQALSRLLVYAPDFLTKSYCIWLGIPDHQRTTATALMSAPEHEGGLSDEQGLEIIEVFIDQNYDALADFFGGKLGSLQRRVQSRQKARKAGRDLG